jgi:hypothetical protein
VLHAGDAPQYRRSLSRGRNTVHAIDNGFLYFGFIALFNELCFSRL